MDGLRPKGHAGTADHPGGCPGQNILEIMNSGRLLHLVRKGVLVQAEVLGNMKGSANNMECRLDIFSNISPVLCYDI